MLMTILTIVFSTGVSLSTTRLSPFLSTSCRGCCSTISSIARQCRSSKKPLPAWDSQAESMFPAAPSHVATVITYLVNWAIALIPLIAIMLVLRQPLSWSLLTVPLGMLLAAVFALGVGLLVATLGAFFHDVKLTYQVLLTGWFYATPIIYPLEIVPEIFRRYFLLNPLLHLLASGPRTGHPGSGGSARELVGCPRIQSCCPGRRLVGLHHAKERL